MGFRATDFMAEGLQAGFEFGLSGFKLQGVVYAGAFVESPHNPSMILTPSTQILNPCLGAPRPSVLGPDSKHGYMSHNLDSLRREVM